MLFGYLHQDRDTFTEGVFSGVRIKTRRSRRCTFDLIIFENLTFAKLSAILRQDYVLKVEAVVRALLPRKQ
jgi:hypothetical protein